MRGTALYSEGPEAEEEAKAEEGAKAKEEAGAKARATWKNGKAPGSGGATTELFLYTDIDSIKAVTEAFRNRSEGKDGEDIQEW